MRTSWKNPPANGATRNKLLWSLAALGAAGALAGLGTFATFTTTTAEQYGDIDTADVELTVGGTGDSLDVADVVPGDTIQRFVDLTNSGDSLGTVTLMVTVDPDEAPLPYADPSRIMRLTVHRCDSLGGSAPNYTCNNPAQILGDNALLGAHPLPALDDLTGTAYLRLTLAFPDDAGDNYQDQTVKVGYTFLGVQRDEGQQ